MPLLLLLLLQGVLLQMHACTAVHLRSLSRMQPWAGMPLTLTLPPLPPQHLIWPPLQFSQLPTHESLQVELVYMHNTLAHPPQVGIPSGFLSAMLHHASGGVQNSSVNEAWLAFSKCETCSAAYSNALKVGAWRAGGCMLGTSSAAVGCRGCAGG